MLNFIRQGSVAPLFLVHGLGGSCRSWTTLLSRLSQVRDLVAINLPGHGDSPLDANSDTFLGLADRVEAFLTDQDLLEIDVVGSSVWARIALELARRGKVGATIALDPGGFWRGWERTYFQTTLTASIWLVRALGSMLPTPSRSTISRSMLLAQVSARPWRLDDGVATTE